MELEIGKNVLLDIAVATLERLDGLEIAAAPLKSAEMLRAGSGPRRPRALRVTRGDGGVTVELGVNVEYGRDLLALSQEAQRAVTENIELMTGLRVRAVNVTVQGLTLPVPAVTGKAAQGAARVQVAPLRTTPLSTLGSAPLRPLRDAE